MTLVEILCQLQRLSASTDENTKETIRERKHKVLLASLLEEHGVEQAALRGYVAAHRPEGKQSEAANDDEKQEEGGKLRANQYDYYHSYHHEIPKGGRKASSEINLRPKRGKQRWGSDAMRRRILKRRAMEAMTERPAADVEDNEVQPLATITANTVVLLQKEKKHVMFSDKADSQHAVLQRAFGNLSIAKEAAVARLRGDIAHHGRPFAPAPTAAVLPPHPRQIHRQNEKYYTAFNALMKCLLHYRGLEFAVEEATPLLSSSSSAAATALPSSLMPSISNSATYGVGLGLLVHSFKIRCATCIQQLQRGIRLKLKRPVMPCSDYSTSSPLEESATVRHDADGQNGPIPEHQQQTKAQQETEESQTMANCIIAVDAEGKIVLSEVVGGAEGERGGGTPLLSADVGREIAQIPGAYILCVRCVGWKCCGKERVNDSELMPEEGGTLPQPTEQDKTEKDNELSFVIEIKRESVPSSSSSSSPSTSHVKAVSSRFGGGIFIAYSDNELATVALGLAAVSTAVSSNEQAAEKHLLLQGARLCVSELCANTSTAESRDGGEDGGGSAGGGGASAGEYGRMTFRGAVALVEKEMMRICQEAQVGECPLLLRAGW